MVRGAEHHLAGDSRALCYSSEPRCAGSSSIFWCLVILEHLGLFLRRLRFFAPSEHRHVASCAVLSSQQTSAGNSRIFEHSEHGDAGDSVVCVLMDSVRSNLGSWDQQDSASTAAASACATVTNHYRCRHASPPLPMSHLQENSWSRVWEGIKADITKRTSFLIFRHLGN